MRDWQIVHDDWELPMVLSRHAPLCRTCHSCPALDIPNGAPYTCRTPEARPVMHSSRTVSLLSLTCSAGIVFTNA